MRFRHHDPHPRLRELVHGYLELEDLHLATPVQNADLPEGTVRLMFSAETVLMGSSLETLHLLRPVTLSRFTLQSQGSVMQGRLRVLVAELYPWAARQLLGWRADEPPARLDAALSASAWGVEVVALLKLGEWQAALESLEAQLLSLAGRQEEPGVGIQAAQQIYHALGTVRVADLADSLSVSPRTLERQFAQQVGVSAKTLARVVRFDAANSRIRLDPDVSMAELTFTLGFFDQAHLIKEFKALSSMTPGAFATFAARHQHSMDLELFRGGGDVYLEVGLPPGFNSEHL